MWCYSFHRVVCLAPPADSRLWLLVLPGISTDREWLLNDLFSLCGKIMICSFQVFQAVPKRGLNEVPKFHPRFSGRQPSTLLFPCVLRNVQTREGLSFSSSSTRLQIFLDD